MDLTKPVTPDLAHTTAVVPMLLFNNNLWVVFSSSIGFVMAKLILFCAGGQLSAVNGTLTELLKHSVMSSALLCLLRRNLNPIGPVKGDSIAGQSVSFFLLSAHTLCFRVQKLYLPFYARPVS